MSDDRIRGLVDAIASALTAGDIERYRSLIESVSEPERDLVITQTLLRAHATTQSMLHAASLEHRQVLEDLDLEIELLDLGGSGGPFLLRTDEELLRLVKACVRRTFTELPYTAESGPLKPASGGPDAGEADLESLVSEAEQLAESELLNQRLTAVVLATGWSLRRGRKTHAAIVPSDLDLVMGMRLETLCGRGSDIYIGGATGGLVLDSVDCPGCWNALALGGFLKDSPLEDSDWLLPARRRRAEVLARQAERWEIERQAREEAGKRALEAAVERDLADIRQRLNDSG